MDNINHRNTNCDAARELIPAYSIGATDPHETVVVESALAECPELANELSEYMALSNVLGHVVTGAANTPAPDTAGLMARIAAIEDEAPVHPLPTPDDPQPVIPERTHHIQPHAAPSGEAYFEAHDTRIPQVRIVRRTRWWAVGFTVAAALVILLATNAYWLMQVTELQDEQDRLQIAIAELEQARDDMLNVNIQQVNHRELMPQVESVEARATVLWNSERSIGSLYVTGLPPLDAGMTYQFWLVRDGHSLSLGTFEIDANGVGTLIFDAPEQIENFEAMGISPEPAQGSDEPTSPHVVIGEI